MILRATGGATSTFGGGGGTKLFCSQALNATHANMTKAIREAAAACPTLPFNVMHAGEHEGFIPVASFNFALAKIFVLSTAFRDP
ncbi:hypothetical protein [Bradyrhizobium lablabi]|uniref:hypothetical protein n=1 Tax=Bradyrhizobium lablabi TaxID=722472 RepID=UPI001FCCD94E|nr:hypothetical protein [Bradyrhizobium lablabi]